MHSTVTIRPATGADAHLLASLGAETFTDTFAAQNRPEDMRVYLASAFGPEIQARELADATNRFYIAEVGGTEVGYLQLRRSGLGAPQAARHPLEVARIYARTGWIGHGIGAALMRAALTEAAAGHHDLLWLAVFENNPRAIAFYRRWGFQVIGHQTFLLGSDLQHDFIMARPVADGRGT